MRPRSVRPARVAIGMLVLLAACARPAAVVTVTSHTDGQRVLGSRAVTLSGTLAGGAVHTLTVDLNGAPVAGVTHTAAAFSAPLDLADGANDVVITATAAGGTTSVALTLVYPHLALATFQPADVVVGQPDFVTRGTTLSQTGLGRGYGDPALIDGVLYLPDYEQNRVLGFLGGVPASNGAAADFVLGQPDFVTGTAGATADTMDGPQTAVAAGGRMYLVEYGNSRVLLYDAPPTTTHAAADDQLGQPAFGTVSPSCTAAGLDSPESLFATADKLIVADSSNHRVLIFDALPTANGAVPDVVLGQASLTTCASNDDDQNGVPDAGPTARTLAYPSDVWSDGTRLVVVDQENHRVLIWNAFPTSNFQPADVVVGHADMTSATAGAGAGGLHTPYFVTSNGNQLFVADADNHRVLIFDAFPTADGAAADAVLGQGDFAHVTGNDDNQDGASDGAPSARTLSYPAGLLALDDALVVVDHDNARVLVYRP